jgi:hypothetical protein
MGAGNLFTARGMAPPFAGAGGAPEIKPVLLSAGC